MKLINGFFVIIFTISAVIQYNDPDPLPWIVIYGYGAVVCLLAIFRKDSNFMHYFGMVVFLSFALYLLLIPDGVFSWITQHGAENITGSMSDEKPWLENTREFFGLLILSLALLLNLIIRKRNPKQKIKTV